MNDKAESAGGGVREVIDFLRGTPAEVAATAGFARLDHGRVVDAVRAAIERRFAGRIRILNQDEIGPRADLTVDDEIGGERLLIDVVFEPPDRLARVLLEHLKGLDEPELGDRRAVLVAGEVGEDDRPTLEALRAQNAFAGHATIVLPWELWGAIAGAADAPAPAPPPPAALRVRMLADRPLVDPQFDKLKFAPIARAFASLIDNPETDTPLAVAINAPWGAGKTSLANMIVARLDAKPAAGGTRPHVVFWFDAWMHDEAENLSVAFLSALGRFLDRRRPWLSRLLRPLPAGLLTTAGQRQRRAWLLAAMAVAAVAVAFAVFVSVPDLIVKYFMLDGARTATGAPPASPTPAAVVLARLSLSGLAFVIAGYAVYLLRQAMEFAGKLGDFVADPKGESGHGGLEALRGQLRRLAHGALPPGSRLVIVVDDLERCRPPGAVNLLETVNQHLAFEDVVVLVLADMSAVGAAALVKYEALAKHYAPADATAHGSGEVGAFGRLYLQKIVQLQFTLPELRQDAVGGLVDDVVAEPPAAPVEAAAGVGARLLARLAKRSFVTAAWRRTSMRRFLTDWTPRFSHRTRHGAMTGPLVVVADSLCRAFAVLQVPALVASRGMIAQNFEDAPAPLRARVPPIWIHLTAYTLFAAGLVVLAGALAGAALVDQGAIVPPDLGAINPIVGLLLVGIAGLAVASFFAAIPVQIDAQQMVQAYNGLIGRLREPQASAAAAAPPTIPGLREIGTLIAEERAALALVNDSDEFRRARNEALRHLRLRPRSVKRVINRLRLTLSVLAERGALGPDAVTPEACGKWVAMQELWPDLADHVIREPDWMDRIEGRARRRPPAAGASRASTATAKRKASDPLEVLVKAVAPQFAGVVGLRRFLAAEPALGPVIDTLVHMSRRGAT